jgi:biotin carboxylase
MEFISYTITKMDRLLLLMPTHTYRAGAFIEAAEQLGLSVVVGSEAEHVLATRIPDRYLKLDFQDLEDSTDRIVEFAERWPIQTVISPEDDAVTLAAMASDALGLTHNKVSAVLAARNKFLMREILAKAGLPSPWYKRFSIVDDPEMVAHEVPYPCVLKPLSLSASRGVIRANNDIQFIEAYRQVVNLLERPEVAAQEGPMAQFVLVEDYLPGKEVALEGLVSDGHLQVLAIFDKPDPLEGPYFEETIYVTPSRHPKALQDAIVEATAKGVSAIGIEDGPLHAELRFNDQGVWIVEIAPRSIGGYCSRTLRFSNGLSLEALILQHAFGMGVDSIRREPSASGVMMIPIPEAGILRKVENKERAEIVPGVDEILLAIPPGQTVTPLPEGNQYLGFIFARGETPAEVEEALRVAHQQLNFVIKP